MPEHLFGNRINRRGLVRLAAGSPAKLDGFRGLLWRAPSGSAHLLSRNLKDLSNAFPQLVRAGRDLPRDTLVDGEIVIADPTDGRTSARCRSALGKRGGTRHETRCGHPRSSSRLTSCGTLVSILSICRYAIGDVALKNCLASAAHTCSWWRRPPPLRTPRNGWRWCPVWRAWSPSAPTVDICLGSATGSTWQRTADCAVIGILTVLCTI